MIMKYYPINLDIRNRKCLVVGGGRVATRKVGTLLACGARVTVVSPAVSPRLEELVRNQAVTVWSRAYRSTDLTDIFLVIGATDDPELNHRIYMDAEGRNTLCNIADRPEVCNFILPAVVNRGDLIIAVSTSGKSPAFAKRLRRKFETEFGEEYAAFLDLMGVIRKKLLHRDHDPESHKAIFSQLVDSRLLDALRTTDTAAANMILTDLLGEGFEMDTLKAEIHPDEHRETTNVHTH
jgi:precorrin-2 dehydrogenase / sirohydrochlorin ferrochelatase